MTELQSRKCVCKPGRVGGQMSSSYWNAASIVIRVRMGAGDLKKWMRLQTHFLDGPLVVILSGLPFMIILYYHFTDRQSRRNRGGWGCKMIPINLNGDFYPLQVLFYRREFMNCFNHPGVFDAHCLRKMPSVSIFLI